MNDDDKSGRPGPMQTEVTQKKTRGRLGRDVQSKIGQQLKVDVRRCRQRGNP